MYTRPDLARPLLVSAAPDRLVSFTVSAVLFVIGAALQMWLYESAQPLLLLILLAAPVLLILVVRGNPKGAELSIFVRTLATSTFAAGVAAYYALVLLDVFQLSSDASSFFELSSQSGPARSIQDLQTITEGAGAVVMWSWFYDTAALLGFSRLPFVGISMNVTLVAIASVVCQRSAHAMYGVDAYRSNRLELFFSISGILWLFAGIHIRDSVIFLAIVVLTHAWIAYLARLDRKKLFPAILITGLMMPTLQVLRAEFFYIPLLVAAVALLALNFTRGRGDSRFIMLVSIVLGIVLLIVALVVFGSQIAQLFLLGQDTYGTLSLEEARSGSLGVSLIVEQALPIRLALGIPYLIYFPIPFWTGFSDESALQLFKSINAVSFYVISAFVFVGIIRIASIRELRSPAFVFCAITPFALSAVVALSSLESRHLGSFMSLFFLVGLLPDLRITAQVKLMRLTLALVLIGVGVVHMAWFALRYA